MADPQTLRVQRAADRVVVVLDAPRRNAIGSQMVAELHAVFGELERAPWRILILTGSDGDFAAGADVGELLARTREDALEGINLRLFERLRALPMPTIAAIDGFALGGGAELAYGCDMRIASDRAIFGQPEVRLGIMAAAGGCHRLAGLVGDGLAKDMLLTGRRLSADEALAAGLVSRIATPQALLDTAHAVADEMLKASVPALRLTKLAANAGADAHPAIELAAQAILFEDAEKHERMRSFVARSAGAPSTMPGEAAT